MPRSKAIAYPFDALPSDIAPVWLTLPFQTRSLGPALWILGGGGEPIPVVEDWAPFLCMQLRIGGKERPNIVQALYRLQKLNLLVVKDGFATVLLRVCQQSAGSPPAVRTPSVGSPQGVREESAASNRSESLESGLTKRLKKEIKEREESAAAEPIVLSRKPVGEPPPGFVDRDEAEPTLEQRIVRAWQAGVGLKGGRQPAETKRALDGASEVATWLRSNVRENETPLSAFQVALKLYLADDKDSLRRNSWPLSWLVERLPGYLAEKPPEKVSSPTHAEWVPPDYEAGMRESEARHRRQQEEWFEKYPECREAHERSEREWAEQQAAEKAARKVVPIAEAKPIKRAEPMTEQQRQERIRFLQAQAEQIRAANAAK